MSSSFRIPKFENGEFLSEYELYQLAWLPFELYCLSHVAKGYVGFFHPGVGSASAWNRFDLERDALTIRRLFVISAEGVPFVTVEPRRLDLSDVTIDRTTLFASAYFVRNSRALKDEHFTVTPGDDVGGSQDQFDSVLFDDVVGLDNQDLERVPNGYQILFHWGADAAPQIEGAQRFSLELGKLVGPDSSAFRLSPQAYYPASLPRLAEVVGGVRANVTLYRELLFDPEVAPGVERSALLDRLEVLELGLGSEHVPTRELVVAAHAALTATTGFLLRVAYALDPGAAEYRGLVGLEGRMLEHQLRLRFRGGKSDLDELITSLIAQPTQLPQSGQDQIEFFQALVPLFEADRIAAAVRGVKPPDTTTQEPRRKRTPVQPIDVYIDKKGSDGD